MMFDLERSAPSRYMRTTWMLSAQTELEVSNFLRIRTLTKDEARLLAESIRKRNVFARHSWENNFYLQRLDELSDRTIIEVFLPGDPRDIAEEAGDAADLLEKIAVLSTTLAMTKEDLQRKLGVGTRLSSEVDFAYDTQLRFLRSRSRATPDVQGVQIDQRFCRRFFKCGFQHLVERHSSYNNLDRRVLASLDWLYEARLEPRLQASIVKTAVALESLLIFSESESLARSLSERAAFILSPSPDTRRKVSDIVKRFYEARSGVVHGSRKKARKLTPALAESVDRLSVLLCLVIRTNSELWPSDDALREWCEDQRWGKPSTDVHIPFARTYMNNALALGRKNV
jgi:hypothetical protein